MLSLPLNFNIPPPSLTYNKVHNSVLNLHPDVYCTLVPLLVATLNRGHPL